MSWTILRGRLRRKGPFGEAKTPLPLEKARSRDALPILAPWEGVSMRSWAPNSRHPRLSQPRRVDRVPVRVVLREVEMEERNAGERRLDRGEEVGALAERLGNERQTP